MNYVQNRLGPISIRRKKLASNWPTSSPVGNWTFIGCLHDRANIEQLAGRSVVISMLIKMVGCNWKAYITRDQLLAKSLSLGLHLSQGAGFQ